MPSDSYSNQTSAQTDDAESKMRQNLGLAGRSDNGSALSLGNDPMKVARQAIRSQVTARDYAERQLGQAQTAVQNLRTKLRHVHQEQEAAVGAAQSATAAKVNAGRNLASAEQALATERVARARTEGILREAEAMIRDLREKLAAANQTIHTIQAEKPPDLGAVCVLGGPRRRRQCAPSGFAI